VSFEALDPDIAIPACENAVQISNIVGNKVWLARAYVKAGQYDLAIPLLEEGLVALSPLAHVVYGNMLLVGEGVEADPARAIALYEAVARDFGLAQFTLGLVYAQGIGVPQDSVKALEWFRLAESYGVNEATEQIAALEAVPNPNAIDLTGFGREGPGY
jgi:TPR repeat protein